ncbi:RbsD/FucU domain-containing protein [Curtobacterium sp. Leaf261]|uniref:RbsD/FucU domain-containing protein n=1 Tax=Curtobacterium sp. Leaf261 TaxID=1736311 RepID=UPI0006F88598|nr:RbsD/FucU domain-containing protein [Curtobacterium sp. Leaf261]KQO63452.1 RbsD or FucU transport [Curtobacterium sp. Leaf261]
MLRYTLTHQPTISALAGLGHGSKILLADGNYPFRTAMNPSAELVYLNYRPGLLDVDQVLETLLEAVPVESATVMEADEHVAAHDGYRSALGADVQFTSLERFAFYDAVRGPELGLVIATGDQRSHANLLLEVGFQPTL